MTLAWLVIGVALAVAAFAVYRLTFVERYYDHFVWQASAFLEGQPGIRAFARAIRVRRPVVRIACTVAARAGSEERRNGAHGDMGGQSSGQSSHGDALAFSAACGGW